MNKHEKVKTASIKITFRLLSEKKNLKQETDNENKKYEENKYLTLSLSHSHKVAQSV